MRTFPDPSAAALLRETDARMTQALDNFFQRSHLPIEAAVLHATATPMGAPLAIGQTCLDWINARPDALSRAFADQFRLHLARPETFTQHHESRPAELQLLGDHALQRQLAEEKTAARLTEVLRADLLLLSGSLQALRRLALEDRDRVECYGPLAVIRALSRALDALDLDAPCGTLLLQCAAAPLLDTLQHTYTALGQFLGAQNGVAALLTTASAAQADAGQAILAHIRSRAAPTDAAGPSMGAPAVAPHRLIDRLTSLEALPTDAPAAAADASLQQLKLATRDAGVAAIDLAVLDAVSGLFGVILADRDVSPAYRTAIARLQIPTLRVALATPDFFGDAQPAHRLIDLLGLFSRRFPEHGAAHARALEAIDAASAAIIGSPGDPTRAFDQALGTLAAWYAVEDAHVDPNLAAEVAQREAAERHRLGTLLALENLRDLTERYPAPESVLRQLEVAWVPHMVSLYLAESGEGPDWRAACHTLRALFLSLQAPEDAAAREARLQSIPVVNAALRHGLQAQGAEPAQMKAFFGAITATQECWIRPAVGLREAAVSSFTPRRSARADEPRGVSLGVPPPDDALRRARGLRQGDWVDFAPPYQGFASARVAWAGMDGDLLLCDDEGEKRLALDCERLADAIRAGKAHIPERSLTRQALLQLRSRLHAGLEQ